MQKNLKQIKRQNWPKKSQNLDIIFVILLKNFQKILKFAFKTIENTKFELDKTGIEKTKRFIIYQLIGKKT